MPLPNVDDVPELVFPSDGEHELEIIGGNEFTSKNNRECLRLNMRVVDEPDADDAQAMVFYPAEADSEKDYRRFAAECRKFQQAFGLKGGETMDDLKGARGRGFIKVKENRQTGNEEAQVTTFV